MWLIDRDCILKLFSRDKLCFSSALFVYDSLEKTYKQVSYYYIFDEATTDDVTGYIRAKKKYIRKEKKKNLFLVGKRTRYSLVSFLTIQPIMYCGNKNESRRRSRTHSRG